MNGPFLRQVRCRAGRARDLGPRRERERPMHGGVPGPAQPPVRVGSAARRPRPAAHVPEAGDDQRAGFLEVPALDGRLHVIEICLHVLHVNVVTYVIVFLHIGEFTCKIIYM